MHAWGMGGTIRTTFNVAQHLAERHDVEVLSVWRTRDEPFFAFPERARVTVLHDERQGAEHGRAARLLSRFPSLLVHPLDYAFPACSLWTDVQLARKLRGLRSGVLVTTRPGFNLLAVRFAPKAS
jgi:hypothetical protein